MRNALSGRRPVEHNKCAPPHLFVLSWCIQVGRFGKYVSKMRRGGDSGAKRCWVFGWRRLKPFCSFAEEWQILRPESIFKNRREIFQKCGSFPAMLGGGT
jgi:hypothetical protein